MERAVHSPGQWKQERQQQTTMSLVKGNQMKRAGACGKQGDTEKGWFVQPEEGEVTG